MAAAACLGKDVVSDAIRTLVLAIQDLIKLDRSVDLAFGFCNVRIINRNLSVCFKEDLTRSIGAPQFEDSMMR